MSVHRIDFGRGRSVCGGYMWMLASESREAVQRAFRGNPDGTFVTVMFTSGCCHSVYRSLAPPSFAHFIPAVKMERRA